MSGIKGKQHYVYQNTEKITRFYANNCKFRKYGQIFLKYNLQRRKSQ